MDQASGGEDPNKPSKKKSNEDEGKNKKLVCIQTACTVVCSQLSHPVIPQAGVNFTLGLRPRKLYYSTVFRELHNTTFSFTLFGNRLIVAIKLQPS